MARSDLPARHTGRRRETEAELYKDSGLQQPRSARHKTWFPAPAFDISDITAFRTFCSRQWQPLPDDWRNSFLFFPFSSLSFLVLVRPFLQPCLHFIHQPQILV